MTIALFIPCYIDQFYPDVGRASLSLLEKHGCEVAIPLGQTCCGQPLGNAGYERDSIPALNLFVQHFREYHYIVAPSGSCVHYIRERIGALATVEGAQEVGEKTFEICEFLTHILNIEDPAISYQRKVGLHNSCHGLRGLALGTGSERRLPPKNLVRDLLAAVDGIELIDLDRPDECCGFGGTFAVTEEAVSTRMGIDRLEDHLRNGTEVITATDMSCLMHLEGLIKRRHLPLQIAHVSEILAGTAP